MLSVKELNSLLIASGRGDATAFRQFYEAVSGQVLGVLMRLLNDRQTAEDALQDAMVVAWHKADQFDPEKSLATTWITSIARYRAIDTLRKRSRQQQLLSVREEDIKHTLGHEESVKAVEPVSQSTLDRINECLSQLNANARQSIQFAYLDGLSCSEIASRLERSLGTVKSWIRRGMIALKECVSA